MKDHKIIYTTKNSSSFFPSSENFSPSSSENNSPPVPSSSFLFSSEFDQNENKINKNKINKNENERNQSNEIELNTSVDSRDVDIQNNPLSNSAAFEFNSSSLRITSPQFKSHHTNDRIITKKDYFLFCLGFSLSIVPVIGVFTCAPVVFEKVGGIGNGIFCIGYTLSSLFYTRNIIHSIGCKSSILWGHIGSGIYICSYLLSTTIAFHYSNILYPIGAFLGGISQSIMWTSQGKYYSLASQFFISSMNPTEIQKSHREMSFLFHRTYLLNLVVMYCFITIVLLLKTTNLAQSSLTPYFFIPSCGLYFCISSYLLFTMNSIGDTGDISTSFSFYFIKSVTILKTIFYSFNKMKTRRKWKIIYLLPFHMTWGLIHPLWVYFILGWVIGNTNLILGIIILSNSLTTFLFLIIEKKYEIKTIQLLLSFFSFSSSSTSSSQSQSQSQLASSPLLLNVGIILGILSCISIGILLLYVDIHYTHYSNLWIILLITVLHGFIRSISENNMTVVLISYFPNNVISTLLIMNTIKTMTCGICFIGFGLTDPRHMNKELYGIIIIIFSCLSLFGYVRANYLNCFEQMELEGSKIYTNDKNRNQRITAENYYLDESYSIATTDLTTPTGLAILKGTIETDLLQSSQSIPHLPTPQQQQPPPSLRLYSHDSSGTESVIYMAEYF